MKLAEAMGAVGMRVTRKEDLAETIRKAIDLNTTVLSTVSSTVMIKYSYGISGS